MSSRRSAGLPKERQKSPLLWNIFYDMVLCALRVRAGGGGERVQLATNGLQFDGGSGRAAFMDDLMICERTVAEMDRMVERRRAWRSGCP